MELNAESNRSEEGLQLRLKSLAYSAPVPGTGPVRSQKPEYLNEWQYQYCLDVLIEGVSAAVLTYAGITPRSSLQ